MHKIRVLLPLLVPLIVAAVCLVALSGAALAVQSPTSDSPPPSGSTASPLLIVEFEAPPLAAAYKTQLRAAGAGPAARLDAASADAEAYVAELQAQQAAFVSRLQTVLPAATVAQYIDATGEGQNLTYQVVFNGMAINPGSGLTPAARAEAGKQIAKLPGVKAVYPDLPHYPALYTSTLVINAPAVWNVLGGRANAGDGVKFASVDGGVHHLSPMFNGAGYAYPNGFGPNGKGLTNNNNGKIITSRAYFRSWDPPQTEDPGLSGCGDACAWPGPKGTSHGVHTSSTAAGNIVTDVVYSGLPIGTISGVAPRAYVMSYKVFYGSVNGDVSFYNAEGIAALEDVVKDGADVLNNSWGNGPYSNGNLGDPIETALANTAAAGVFVAMSAGNSGPSNSTLDHPLPDYMNVAATTTGGTLASGRLSVPGSPVADKPYAEASFGTPLPIATVITYPVLPAASVDATNVTGCDPWPAGAFTGKAAVIQRGGCEFGVKVLNAEQAGATFAIVYNTPAGGDELINMGPGAVGQNATIGSLFVGNTAGQAIVAAYTADPAAVAVINTIAFQLGNTPDVLANFSSRGPGVGLALLPDIAAPGVNILAQGYTPGATGEAQYLGYGQASGTSMAAPHVAGAAILVRQAYPQWSNAQIKSALMTTAKYTDVYNYDGTPAQPLDMGAGRLDLTNVLNPGVILDPPSVSFGAVPTGTVQTLAVTVTNIATETESYSLGTLYTGGGFTATTALPGFSVTPTVFSLGFGQSQVVSVTVTTTDSQGIAENQGYIVLDGTAHDAHMPVWARVIPSAPVADVLIIDNDASGLDPSFGDYLAVYTATLDALGRTYQVVNTADSIGADVTIPDPAHLAGYGAVLWFTGDNYVPTAGLTPDDQYALLDYLNNGGKVIAMGQDLAATVDAAPGSQTNWLYNWGLGAAWLQDSISNGLIPGGYATRAPSAPPLFNGVVVSLTQLYIDELSPNYPDRDTTRGGVPILNYGGPFNVQNGTVALSHRDQPQLEAPQLPYAGKAFYASFGLEGMGVGTNGVVTPTTPAELLGRVFTWVDSQPGTASISNTTPATTTAVTLFTASYTATVPAGYPPSIVNPIAWRWDFGDGSAFVASDGPAAGHTYACAAEGSGEDNVHTVRVEVTDGLGNKAIASQDVDVAQSCYVEPQTIQKFFMPWIGKFFGGQ